MSELWKDLPLLSQILAGLAYRTVEGKLAGPENGEQAFCEHIRIVWNIQDLNSSLFDYIFTFATSTSALSNLSPQPS